MTDEHEVFGDDPISDLAAIKRPTQKVDPAVPPELKTTVMKAVDRQAPFFDMIAQFHRLFEEIPQMTTREVDARIQELFKTFLEACEKVGISKMSVPQLKECCGKKRIWKDEAPEPEKKGLRLGDRLAWLFSKLGFKSCPGCKRRQALLNELFKKKDAT